MHMCDYNRNELNLDKASNCYPFLFKSVLLWLSPQLKPFHNSFISYLISDIATSTGVLKQWITITLTKNAS